MFTSLILLNRNIALRALLRLDTNRPFFQKLGLSLFTRQILMPLHGALKAEIFLALVALYLRCVLVRCLHYDILAFRIWAELL